MSQRYIGVPDWFGTPLPGVFSGGDPVRIDPETTAELFVIKETRNGVG